MNKNLGIAFIVILLALVGWIVYRDIQGSRAEAPEQAMEQDVRNTELMVLSASFSCEDKTHFIAEFPTAQSARIVVDGKVTKTLPLVPGAGQRFEDATSVYVFAGEEASVTSKASGKTTACSQPMDQNNAPVNFGDAGEGSGAQGDVSSAVSLSLIGTWQSKDDVKFVREMKADGTANDIYDGKVVSTGTWKVFSKEKPIKVDFALDAGATYIQVADKALKGEILNFKLSKLIPEEVQLTLVGRGVVLSFKKL